MTTTPETKTPKHAQIRIYLWADNCDHPEPDGDGPDWDRWDSEHEFGDADERLCMLTPLGVSCPVCTAVAADTEDLPMDEYVACRESAATTGEAK